MGRWVRTSGERELQERCGTSRRAAAFYREQVRGHLNEAMRRFIGRMEMVFVATSDADGNCDCSLRAGPPGFVRTIDDRTLAYPEYRGNGVMASQGNRLMRPASSSARTSRPVRGGRNGRHDG